MKTGPIPVEGKQRILDRLHDTDAMTSREIQDAMFGETAALSGRGFVGSLTKAGLVQGVDENIA
jgi:hypothetical protein